MIARPAARPVARVILSVVYLAAGLLHIATPGSFHHALYGLPPDQIQVGWWYHVPRLMLQPVLVWWPLWASKAFFSEEKKQKTFY